MKTVYGVIIMNIMETVEIDRLQIIIKQYWTLDNIYTFINYLKETKKSNIF